MRFRLLGALNVETEAGPVDLGPHKQRSLLAVLLLHANEIVPTDRLIDLVWGESPPRTAEHSVHIYVSELRKSLSNGTRPDLIETRPPGYVLHVPPDEVDILQFESLVREGLAAARAGDLDRGGTCLETALEWWTGDPLADFSYDEFAQEYIRSLRELRSDALEALAGIHLDEGDLDSTRRRAGEALEGDPLREEPHRLMMLALYRSGRQAEALRHYSEFQELLGEELGIEPSEGLRDLEERILLQDPSLGVSPPPAPRANPYRGLRPFTEEDAKVFFGRESLVAQVLDKLDAGPGLVSIVGPSGSGKSSAALAGVVPELRRQGVVVAVMQPGARPLWELAGTLDRAGFGSRASLSRRFETDARSLVGTVRRPIVLIVDQFEELFTLAETGAQVRFSELISHAIRAPESPLQVITTLRADYYDRPLSIPVLADLFVDSVVNMRPMTPYELEQAVVEPARAVGAEVDPALLAQLVADMSEEPGALPLLQVTLFELFELTEGALTLAGYEKLGGLHGALAGGAEELLSVFNTEGRSLIEQLMMRMVQKGQMVSTARPVALRELLDLDVDSVLLQGVLEAFAAQRLLTFDRDSSGVAVVEMAHEYLLSEWPRMVEWIEVHSEDLDRIRALDAAASEWLDAGRSADYLLRGERLHGFHTWSETTSLRLTRTETEFIETSLQLRHEEKQQQLEREAKEESLARSARRRLWAFGAAVVVLAAAITVLVMVLIPDPPPDVVVWYDGRGDAAFGDLVGDGIDAAAQAFDIEVREMTQPTDADEIEALVDRGTKLVLIDPLKAWAVGLDLPRSHPDTDFVVTDCSTEYLADPDLPPNVSCIATQNEEAGFVAGVAAGLATDTRHVGMLGGVEDPVIQEFHEGFIQGVAWVDPAIDVDVVYLSGFNGDFIDFGGFNSPTMARMGASWLYESGADVVFHAAGASAGGLHSAAAYYSEASGSEVWAIGVDVDEYYSMELQGWMFMPDPQPTLERWRSHLLTSALKRIDLGVYEVIRRHLEDGEIGTVTLSIANGGVGYAESGGHIEPYVSDLERAMSAVAEGDVQIAVSYEEPVVLLEDLFMSEG